MLLLSFYYCQMLSKLLTLPSTSTHQLRRRSLEHELELGPLEHVLQGRRSFLEPQDEHREFLGEVLDNPRHPAHAGPTVHLAELLSLVEQGVEEGGEVLLQDPELLQLSEMEVLRAEGVRASVGFECG